MTDAPRRRPAERRHPHVELGAAGPVDPGAFWTGEWLDALARHGDRAADDADRLGLPPIAIAVDDDVWTLRRGADGVEAVPGRETTVEIALDRDAFSDLVVERRTGLGLVIGARADGDPAANDAFCAWDPVLRSVLDGRGVYRPGDVTLARARRFAARPRPAVPTRRAAGGRRRTSWPKPGSSCSRASSPTTRSTPSTPTSPGPSPMRVRTTASPGGRRPGPARAIRAASSTSNAGRSRCARRSARPASSRSARSSATGTARATRSGSTSPPSPRRVW